MISRTSIWLAVLFALALLAQPAAAQDDDSLYDEITVTVTPGTISDFRLNCPDGYFAAAGGVRDVDGGGVKVVRSQASANGRSWEFILDHRNLPGPTVTAWIICLKIEEPRKGQVVRQAHRVVKQRKELPQQAAAAFEIKCPKGMHPTGWGIDVPLSQTGRAHSSGVGSAAAQIDVARAEPSAGRAQFDLLNAGDRAVETTLSLACEAREATSKPKKGRKGSRFRRRIVVRKKTDEEDVRQGNNDRIHKRCGARPRRGVARTAAFSSPESISTWWDFRNPDGSAGGTSVFTTFADGKGEGTWSIFSAFNRSVELFLLCRSVETRWQRIR